MPLSYGVVIVCSVFSFALQHAVLFLNGVPVKRHIENLSLFFLYLYVFVRKSYRGSMKDGIFAAVGKLPSCLLWLCLPRDFVAVVVFYRILIVMDEIQGQTLVECSAFLGFIDSKRLSSYDNNHLYMQTRL